MIFNWDKSVSSKGYVLKGAQSIYGVHFSINTAVRGSKCVGHNYCEHKDDIVPRARPFWK